MKSEGQLWVERRIHKIIPIFDDLLNNITPSYYSNSAFYIQDILDTILDEYFDKPSNSKIEKSSWSDDNYSSVISYMEDLFKKQLLEKYNSEKQSSIKESVTDGIIEMSAIKKHWMKQKTKGPIYFDKEELPFWGLNTFDLRARAQQIFQDIVGGEEFAEKFIKKLINKTFSTRDFNLVEGNDFKWIVNKYKLDDYTFFLFCECLSGGTIIVDNEIQDMSLMNDYDSLMSYDIRLELRSIIQDCMDKIIVPVTGEEVIIKQVIIPD